MQIVEKSVALSSLTIVECASLVATEGKSITMTVDGVKKTIAAVTNKGKIQMVVN